jgi:aminoglycoside/choline kinase family phosphotransferase
MQAQQFASELLNELDRQPDALRIQEKSRSLPEQLRAKLVGEISITPIKSGASSKAFFRATAKGHSVVVMQAKEDFEQLLASYVSAGAVIANAVGRSCDVLATHPRLAIIVFTDLGNYSLEHFLKETQNPMERQQLIAQILDDLGSIQEVGNIQAACKTRNLGSQPLGADRLLDEVKRTRDGCLVESGMTVNDASAQGIMVEFERLINVACDWGFGWAHRDVHCRNVLVKRQGKKGVNLPYYIDYQDSTLAPCAYDAASLASDPFANYNEAEYQYISDIAARQLTSRHRYPRSLDEIGCNIDLLAVQRLYKQIGNFAHAGNWLSSTKAREVQMACWTRIISLSKRRTILKKLGEYIQRFHKL